MPLNRTQNKLLLDNCSPQSAVFTWGGSNLLFDEASEAFLHGQDELSGGSTTQQYHLLCYFRHNTLLKPKGLPRKRQLIQWKVSVELRYYSFSICILLWLSGPIHSPELKIRGNSAELWEDGDLWKGDNIRAGISLHKNKTTRKIRDCSFLVKSKWANLKIQQDYCTSISPRFKTEPRASWKQTYACYSLTLSWTSSLGTNDQFHHVCWSHCVHKKLTT